MQLQYCYQNNEEHHNQRFVYGSVLSNRTMSNAEVRIAQHE